MWVIVVLLFIGASDGVCQTLTGPESINPSMEEITRCAPEPMREPINDAIKNLRKAGEITQELYKALTGAFASNCKKLAKHLRTLNIDELLKAENISSKFGEEDAQMISAMLKDKNTGFKNFLYTLTHLDLHLLGYVSILHGMLNKGLKLDVIDLTHNLDLIQRGILELQENFQLLSYLSLAYGEIEGYGMILEGMRHQLFKMTVMINSLSAITEDLRTAYLSLLDKGDCNGDQITLALGLTQKKVEAIKNEG